MQTHTSAESKVKKIAVATVAPPHQKPHKVEGWAAIRDRKVASGSRIRPL
jgi:hypothetical protein